MEYKIEFTKEYDKYKAKPYKRMKEALDDLECAYTNYYMEGCSDYEGFTREDYESMRSLFRKLRPVFENIGLDLDKIDRSALIDLEIYNSIENGELIGSFNIIDKDDLIRLIGNGYPDTICDNIMDEIEYLWSYRKELRNVNNIKLVKLTVDLEDLVKISY